MKDKKWYCPNCDDFTYLESNYVKDCNIMVFCEYCGDHIANIPYFNYIDEDGKRQYDPNLPIIEGYEEFEE